MDNFILVASDVHKDSDAFEQLASIADSPSCIAFLYAGDLDIDDWLISDRIRKREFVFIPVAGNCDRPYSFVDAGLAPPPLFRTGTFGKLKIFISHGHYYLSPEDAGLNNNDFDIVITGHTHVPTLTVKGKTLFMNPGSASLPRGGSLPSYGVIILKKNSVLAETRILDSKKTISSLEISLI